mmetsp:Transcript_20824/g.57573  ORF Transcript_20824/g.57573 Transcript_20824/m.57573 type:complete len:206 (-) Transcript_20824:1641-2258(-)
MIQNLLCRSSSQNRPRSLMSSKLRRLIRNHRRTLPHRHQMLPSLRIQKRTQKLHSSWMKHQTPNQQIFGTLRRIHCCYSRMNPCRLRQRVLRRVFQARSRLHLPLPSHFAQMPQTTKKKRTFSTLRMKICCLILLQTQTPSRHHQTQAISCWNQTTMSMFWIHLQSPRPLNFRSPTLFCWSRQSLYCPRRKQPFYWRHHQTLLIC